jgi:peroxiredoxin
MALWITALAGCQDIGRKPTAKNATAKRALAAPENDPERQPQSDPTSTLPHGDGDGTPTGGQTTPTAGTTQVAEPPAKRITVLKPPTVRPAAMPEVVLSAAHADACVVRVGDEFPEFRLPDVSGRERGLDDLRGDTLTVVVFWSGDRLLSADQLHYLQERIVAYAELGVKVIAINVGDPPPRVRETVEESIHSLTVVLDVQRRLFARVGRDHLPRTYLLDREGRVLWFDIEFSRHTREKLEQAIHASLRST